MTTPHDAGGGALEAVTAGLTVTAYRGHRRGC